MTDDGAPLHLVLYGRSYCHLCDDMLKALEPLQLEFRFETKVLDVDEDPELEARYDELVPVLTADGVELCHHFLDEDKVRQYLLRNGGGGRKKMDDGVDKL